MEWWHWLIFTFVILIVPALMRKAWQEMKGKDLSEEELEEIRKAKEKREAEEAEKERQKKEQEDKEKE